jgi:tRNA (guanine26-N2/guanine27-N2)-dimethyltransferase
MILFEKKLKTKNESWKLLDLLEEEADGSLFFYTTDSLASVLKKSAPKTKIIFEKLRKKGFDVFRTHFCQTGFKTNAPIDEVKLIF